MFFLFSSIKKLFRCRSNKITNEELLRIRIGRIDPK